MPLIVASEPTVSVLVMFTFPFSVTVGELTVVFGASTVTSAEDFIVIAPRAFMVIVLAGALMVMAPVVHSMSNGPFRVLSVIAL